MIEFYLRTGFYTFIKCIFTLYLLCGDLASSLFFKAPWLYGKIHDLRCRCQNYWAVQFLFERKPQMQLRNPYTISWWVSHLPPAHISVQHCFRTEYSYEAFEQHNAEIRLHAWYMYVTLQNLGMYKQKLCKTDSQHTTDLKNNSIS